MNRRTRFQPSAVFWGLLVSHGLFVLSGATYSVYWVLQEMAPGPAALWTFLLALVLGFGGATGELAGVIGARPETSSNGRFGLGHIVGACVALLIVTYVLTTVVMGRVFTSELIFAMAWATLELCALHDAHRRGWIPRRKAFAATTLVILALAFGLVCYAVYFLLEGRARFYAGLAPYCVASLAMLLVAVLLLLEKKRSGGPSQSP
jgi:Ca2+/Na+ antiporter